MISLFFNVIYESEKGMRLESAAAPATVIEDELSIYHLDFSKEGGSEKES